MSIRVYVSVCLLVKEEEDLPGQTNKQTRKKIEKKLKKSN